MTDNVLCRDVDPKTVSDDQVGAFCNFTAGPNSPPPALLSVTIGKTALCPEKAIDASAQLSIKLQSYFDRHFEEPQDVFQTGDMIYFRVDIENPQATIDEVTFNAITINSQDISPDDLYFVDEIRGNASWIQNIDFEVIEQITRPLSTNERGHLSFGFRLLRQSLNTVYTLLSANAGASGSLTVTVTIDILYHGNQRRSLQFSRSVSGDLLTESHVITVTDNKDGVDENMDVDGEYNSAISTTSSFSVLFLLIAAFLAALQF